jgi:hypothetical protein
LTDYLYQVRVYANVSMLPRGTAGPGMQQNNADLGGYGTTATAGPAPMAQTMRFVADEIVPNAIATAPTAANIQTAIASCGTDIQNQITTAVLGVIQGWATGGQ